jgi:hypothetical protein
MNVKPRAFHLTGISVPSAQTAEELDSTEKFPLGLKFH